MYTPSRPRVHNMCHRNTLGHWLRSIHRRRIRNRYTTHHAYTHPTTPRVMHRDANDTVRTSAQVHVDIDTLWPRAARGRPRLIVSISRYTPRHATYHTAPNSAARRVRPSESAVLNTYPTGPAQTSERSSGARASHRYSRPRLLAPLKEAEDVLPRVPGRSSQYAHHTARWHCAVRIMHSESVPQPPMTSQGVGSQDQ